MNANLRADDPRLPPVPTRLALVKLFLELELYEPALMVVSGVMAVDDQEVEAWYLEGWCFFMMTERAQENGGTFNELTWEQLGKDARDCLDACQTVSTRHRSFVPCRTDASPTSFILPKSTPTRRY